MESTEWNLLVDDPSELQVVSHGKTPYELNYPYM